MRTIRSSRLLFAGATFVPLLLASCVVLVVYLPGLPGLPPRTIWQALVWLPPVAAVLLLQSIPFASFINRAVATVTFGVIMLLLLFGAMFFGACSFGDCI